MAHPLDATLAVRPDQITEEVDRRRYQLALRLCGTAFTWCPGPLHRPVDPFPSLRQLTDGLARGEWSSGRAHQGGSAAGERLDGPLNCFITLDEEKAMAAAERADRLLGTARATPLTGVPLAHKDIFCMEGWRTTCASRMLADFVAPYTATAMAQLEDAGA